MTPTGELIRIALLALVTGVAVPLLVQLFLTLRSLRLATKAVEARLDKLLGDVNAIADDVRARATNPGPLAASLSAALPAIIAGVQAFRASMHSGAAPTTWRTTPVRRPRGSPSRSAAPPRRRATPSTRPCATAPIPEPGMWFLEASKSRGGAALETVLVSGETYLDSLKGYVGFTEDSSKLLSAVQPIVEPHVERIIDDFYDRITEHPGARRAITGGEAQIGRLKSTLRRWLDELLRGPHDQAYLHRRARFGRVHVQIGLPQAYMFTAMNRIRVQVAAIIDGALAAEPALREKTLEAFHQIADLELAIMLETYREDMEEKTRMSDRLATIGQFAAGIGHALRTPHSVIESSVFLLRQRPVHEHEQRAARPGAERTAQAAPGLLADAPRYRHRGRAPARWCRGLDVGLAGRVYSGGSRPARAGADEPDDERRPGHGRGGAPVGRRDEGGRRDPDPGARQRPRGSPRAEIAYR